MNGSSTTLASSVAYMPFGPMKGLTYGNSLTFSATYNTDYYLTNRTVSGSIYNWTYTPDADGNITQAGSTTYGYDALNRVNAENPGSSISYTYDATDNRLTKVQGGTTTTTVPSTSNKISAVGTNSYTYDNSGNITGDGVNTYTWSAAGLLGIVKVGGTTVGTYTYNAWNQRAKKVAASTAYYVYGAGGLLYGEYDTSGNFTREYVYLNSAPLAQINSGTPEVLTYLHTDHLGTPRFGTNASGTQVWSWNNDAFGTSAPTGTATVNLRMPGQYYDSESGLFYNWNRIYNPAIGRYISSDLIGLAGGLNTFGYVAQNPVNLIDPAGLAHCAYSITSHTFTCTADTFVGVGPPAPLTVGPGGVFSGGSECRDNASSVCLDSSWKGPVLPKTYEMIRSDKYGGSYWLKESFLDRRLCSLDVGRCEFFLHEGTGSAGCINVDKRDYNALSQWDELMNLLDSEPDNTLTVAP